MLLECTFHGLIDSRYLAYKCIRKGFICNNMQSHTAFRMMTCSELYHSLVPFHTRLLEYNGCEIADKLCFDASCPIEANIGFRLALEQMDSKKVNSNKAYTYTSNRWRNETISSDVDRISNASIAIECFVQRE